MQNKFFKFSVLHKAYHEPKGVLNSYDALNLAQDIFGEVTDKIIPKLYPNAKRDENRKINDELTLSQFPGAITDDLFIKDQYELVGEGSFKFANSSAEEMGCGSVAAYNVMHLAGKNVSFQEVLYETDIGTVGGGVNILVIGKYLENEGYEVNYLLGDTIDRESNKYEALIVTCANIKFEGHYYTMIPIGKENEEGKNLYQFYNGYETFTNRVGTYEEGVISPGKEKGLNIHLAIGVKK